MRPFKKQAQKKTVKFGFGSDIPTSLEEELTCSEYLDWGEQNLWKNILADEKS